MKQRFPRSVMMFVCGFFCLPAVTFAQSVITGVVKDTSGAVLPGVQVEASSPALIEQVRTVYTDSDGLYRIVDLRPGVYSVTFTLAGFATVVREGMELPAAFTATVNADLRIGALEEMVTVTGASPLVDTRTVAQQATIPREVRDALPLPSNSGGFVVMIPGAIQAAADRDVGGIRGEQTQSFAIHGGRAADTQMLRDGMDFGQFMGGGNRASSINPASTQEFVVVTQGLASAEAGGVGINAIPREGGNSLHGTLQGNFGSAGLQGNNIDDNLRSRGVTMPGDIRSLYDVAFGVGGPIKTNKLWFFSSGRVWITESYLTGNYFNARQGTLFYEPDLTRPAYEDNFYKEFSTRLTWQAAQKHKFAVTYIRDDSCQCHVGQRAGTLSPEAAGDNHFEPNWRVQSKWTSPMTDRLLFDAGISFLGGRIERRSTGGTDDDFVITDASRNYTYGHHGRSFNNPPNVGGNIEWGTFNSQATASYITGRQALTLGLQHRYAYRDDHFRINHGMSYVFNGVVPQSVTLWASPFENRTRQQMLALYAQDMWTMGGVTLNLGLRFDRLHGYAPPVSAPAGQFVPARDYPGADAFKWTDLNPRVGVVWDLFGNGRTALKASFGRYLSIVTHNDAITFTPALSTVVSASRTWLDANGDYVPQESELGPISDQNFGRPVQGTTYDPEVVRGFGNRDYSWQGALAFDHTLLDNLRIGVAYFRTSYGNFRVTDNLLITPDDFSPYSVRAPTDSRLPGGGGEIITGLYDLNPNKFGQVANYVTRASNFGRQSDIYNGVDVNVTGRFDGGVVLTGGLSVGRQVTDNCGVIVDSPQMRFCKVTPAWGAATQVKISGVFPLPKGFNVSAVWQNIAGIATTSDYQYRNAEVIGLGRPLSGGANAARVVELIAPATNFPEGRGNQVDFRVSRRFQFRGIRIDPQVNLYNLTNANDVLQLVTRYGPAWQDVRNVLPARLVKFGLQVDF